ncbi:ABC-type phosphate transport system, permease component [Serpentinimonas maccroryi]|uniref:Phosphate transport system permease protein n=1 Tax=Serpentinimonas maccroryi TaxID=1458426 RepID=A0A060NV11_9BURK|nr:phosphate ABC transporter permease subunit PstC [Serpentinimonas maccroryi]MBA4253309.1 phosphate ABC transporter permease subunit PstC [Comamonadaceae bacterium]OYX54773.1 MAG: phosphate ABC transporter permease subunit PstC [Comamonadaceae bacterium 32-67-11]BAO83353.1 ABC-type phosphate transport system, permease component [Serpentinimonas maccroryi]
MSTTRSRFHPQHSRHVKERVVQFILFLSALSAIAITVAVVTILVVESMGFFRHVSIWDFLTDTQWTPLFAEPRYGILPLVTATLVVTSIGLLVAVPLGTLAALYLGEFAPHKVREVCKPALEMLSGVPSVVYGYFALLLVTPVLTLIIPGLSGFNMLSAGLVIGVSIVPFVSSMSEDAMRAVPMDIREGSYAMGATRLQTAWYVVFPAALSGIVAAYILAMSVALGQTMIVAIAAGQQANFTLDPTQPAATLTAYIAQVALGDVAHGTIEYQSIFAVGLVLLLMTLVLNILGHYLRRRYREVY